MLTAERIRSILDYNPETGDFHWKATGKKAGYKRPDGYVVILIDKVPRLCHRLAWLYVKGENPKETIDHMNWNRSDNRICNLRELSLADNTRNRNPNKVKTRGYSFRKEANRFRAYIGIKGKSKHLGYFNTAEEARAAFLEAKRLYHKGCTI